VSQFKTGADQHLVTVADLPDFIARIPKTAKVFSLDCFDTLIWRNVAMPSDVFLQLQLGEVFKKNGLTAAKRSRAEADLRGTLSIQGAPHEVSLRDIYAHALGAARDDDVSALIDAEIEEEKRLCFIFDPIFDLAIAAKKAGLRTVVVSDTYLDSQQLKDLIVSCARKTGRESPIDDYYASSDFGISKTMGLLARVAEDLNIEPKHMVHLGDNPKADFEGARRVGAHGCHFQQFSAKTEAIIRQFENASSILLPHIRHTHPLLSSWRDAWACYVEKGTPELMSKYTLGPLFFNFSFWIRNEVMALQARGETVKLVFLMRDGYLASLSCQELALADQTLQNVPMFDLEISRFVAIAASFTSRASIVNYLSEFGLTPAYREILTQLLFEENEIRAIANLFDTNDAGLAKFYSEILQPGWVEKIIKRSSCYRVRFYERIKKRVSPATGDTLVFVDLGYSGTIHKLIAPILEKDFQVKIHSRFLIMRGMEDRNFEMKGLISGQEYDERTLQCLLSNIAYLEQICANQTPSVFDFSDEGEPKFSTEAIPDKQIKMREGIQSATLQFLRFAFSDKRHHLSGKEMKDETIGLLGRFLITPCQDELNFFDGVAHDVNLGSSQTVSLLNRGENLLIAQKRGLMGLGDLGSRAELSLAWKIRSLGLNSLAHFAALLRYGLKTSGIDDWHSSLPVMLFSNKGTGAGQIDLYRTYDGFVRGLVPVNSSVQGVGLLLGRDYSWIQLQSVCLEPMADAFSKYVSGKSGKNLLPSLQFNNVTVHQEGILQMEDKAAFVLLHPAEHQSAWCSGEMYCEVVFRPLAVR